MFFLPNLFISKKICKFFKKVLLPPNDSHFRFDWPAAAQNANDVVKSLSCVESSKHRALIRDVLMTLRSSRIWPRHWRSAQQQANETGNGCHLAEVAAFEKFFVAMLSTYKMGFNGICHISRAIHGSKTSHLRGVMGGHQTCFCQTFRLSCFDELPDVVLPKIAQICQI